MRKYPCPICGKRACDSDKSLRLVRLTDNPDADLSIKCQNCKTALAVYVQEELVPSAAAPHSIFLK